MTDEDIMGLKAGESVLITGEIYTARDVTIKIIRATENQQLPLDLQGKIFYYVGPAPINLVRWLVPLGLLPAAEWMLILLLCCPGPKSMYWERYDEATKKALQEYKAVYLAATGGAGALLAKRLFIEPIAYEELGPEAIQRMVVEDFGYGDK